MMYGLADRPPIPTAAFVGFQHLLAIFGGILTAPLLIALGMGLSAEDTTYLISSALVVSGFATLVQIHRIGILGAGLLSIQGTSFAFIGPLVFAYQKLILDTPPNEALGVVFGSCALCAVVMIFLSAFIRQLKNIITTNVSGTAIILIGLSLVIATIQNLVRSFNDAGGVDGDGVPLMLLAALVFGVIVVLANLRFAWLRLASITIGLGIGTIGASLMDIVDVESLSNVAPFFYPEFMRFPLAVDWQVVFLVMPIFLVSAMESIGDLTATNNLSDLETGTPDYWLRVRGGVMATGFNSFVAALFCTFPSTTFSQNNGVIRLTGVASRYIGIYVAGFLVVLGCIPFVAALFQAIPGVVIYGATLLMFLLVAVSGYRVVEAANPRKRDWLVVAGAIVLGYAIATFIDRVPGLSPEIVMVLQFPVSTGAIVAIVLEQVVPGRSRT